MRRCKAVVPCCFDCWTVSNYRNSREIKVEIDSAAVQGTYLGTYCSTHLQSQPGRRGLIAESISQLSGRQERLVLGCEVQKIEKGNSCEEEKRCHCRTPRDFDWNTVPRFRVFPQCFDVIHSSSHMYHDQLYYT